MSKKELVVVAHPDDEALFFSGTILQNMKAPKVICVTDGNADGRGPQRGQEFAKSMALLGVKDFEQWNYPDCYEKRLDIVSLQSDLSQQKAASVYTHSPIGEYHHPHHQDVSFAVHSVFSDQIPVYSVAYNTKASLIVELTESHYQKKYEVVNQCYQGEVKRFIHLLPVLDREGFCQVSLSEAESIYQFLTGKGKLDRGKLDAYANYYPYLNLNSGIPERVF